MSVLFIKFLYVLESESTNKHNRTISKQVYLTTIKSSVLFTLIVLINKR